MRSTAKLFSAVMLMLVSITMIVCTSFAWLTLSDSPALSGIKITIGVDTSIKIAQNINEVVDGIEVNYPSKFVSTATLETPDALLSPVSTADGINWFIPIYDEKGQIIEGESIFLLDDTSMYHNSKDGGYISLDFWLVSPLDECYVRICSGTDNETGTYVVQLPESIKSFTNDSGYVLNDNYATLSSSARVGFLVNDEDITSNEDIIAYANSRNYEKVYRSLKGVYNDTSSKDFAIFEPNGLIHPNEGHAVIYTDDGFNSVMLRNGEYWITNPIGIDDEGIIGPVDIRDRLIVQTESGWAKAEDGSLIINEMYQAYLYLSDDPSLEDFYENTIHNSFVQYVYAGNLIKNSWELYMGSNLNYATKDEVFMMSKTNAVVPNEIVKLEKNVPQRVRMFVWIEGQDVDCNASLADEVIAIRLELAGSTGA